MQGGGANQNSRFALTRAIVEEGTFSIDRYRDTTFDKAWKDGHFYSDKAPGLSFAAVPAYAIWYTLIGQSDGPLPLWFVTIATVGLASGLASGILVVLLGELKISPFVSFASAIAWTIGTPAFGYATLFVSHQFTAALLVMSTFLLLRKRLAIAGFIAGLSSISEYPPAGIALMLALFALVRYGRKSWSFFVSATPLLILLFTYNHICFKSPFALGYSALTQPEFRSAMGGGLYGVGVPDFSVMSELLFGEFRGILPLSPFLVLAPLGMGMMVMDKSRRYEGLLCAAAVVFMLLVASGYSVWSGGAAMGPRHLVPALPFAVVLSAVCADWLLSRRNIFITCVLIAITVLSIAICTATVAVMPELPDAKAAAMPYEDIEVKDPKHPLRTFVIPLFLRGRLSVKAVQQGGSIGLDCWVKGHEWDAYNWGEAMGLSGLFSLVPLLIFWGSVGLLAIRGPIRSLENTK